MPEFAIEGVGDAGAAGRRLGLTLLPGVVDHHVHLGLVDHGLLADGPVVEVHDLGWEPATAAALRAAPPAGVTVRMAGPFHTAPGGYPSGRSWAPDGSVRAVASPEEAAAAVGEARRAGYDFVKITLHTELALLDDETLRALVEAAHLAGLPALVHAEGTGQAARAVDAGADVLVHAPWTERLEEDVLVRGRRMTWYSTLAIHAEEDQTRAIDNICRFRALGGQVRYGTDMGNGPTPVGVNGPEILALGEAGLAGEELIAAVTGPVTAPLPASRVLASSHPLPHTAAELVDWLATARRLTLLDPEESDVRH